MNSVLEDISGVVGHIYKIINTATNKYYVGQAMSHRKNRGKYKPFGFEGRFRDHISEAICNTKKKQCRYLNNAIRLYSKDVFSVVLLKTCPLEDMDRWEQHYIEELNTFYPNGYNLTKGGKTIVKADAKNVDTLITNPARPRGGCVCRTEATRELISKGIKEALKTESVRDSLMKRAQVQHSKQKLERFRDVVIDLTNLDQYISSKHIDGHLAAIVKVDDKKASFVGKYETLESLTERAKEFLREISKTFATSSNCSGSP
uniref:GIY-YIG domain-containing protein n=1 Tax=viral metagenome TaxID=1070528 RepID=A0A6C0AP26_9ZZZZ